MKALLLALALSFATLLPAPAAESAKLYQVTGQIVELTDKTIVVQKGEERWEIARDAATKADGKLKVGDKVTIHYRMNAVSIESKPSSGTDNKNKTK